MSALLLIPAFIVLAFYVLVFALCRISARSDRRVEGMHRGPGGWRL